MPDTLEKHRPRTRPPRLVPPMLATRGPLPSGEAWVYEAKWDGVRAVGHVEHGRVRLVSRNLRDITHQYPEIAGLARMLEGRDAVLDGEIVALDEQGRPDFGLLQQRMGVGSAAIARARTDRTPVTYVLFDVLHLDGEDTTHLPYRERRRLLERLRLQGPHWTTPRIHVGDGADFLEAARARGLEGIVAKRTDAPYTPGRRSPAWVKVRALRGQELLLGGWTAGEGARRGRIGALLVGYWDRPRGEAGRRFVYGGRVGTGFSDRTLEDLARRLAPLERSTSPFEVGDPPRGARFAEPRLVGEFSFTEWTREGMLRHPSFKGLREDKDPDDVVREEGT